MGKTPKTGLITVYSYTELKLFLTSYECKTKWAWAKIDQVSLILTNPSRIEIKRSGKSVSVKIHQGNAVQRMSFTSI